MKALYQPKDQVELSLIKSIFDSEGISYFVHNDNFGSLRIGPQIDLYNARTIMVHENDFEDASELLSDFIRNTDDTKESSASKYSLLEKVRFIIESILFGWFVPGRKYEKKS